MNKSEFELVLREFLLIDYPANEDVSCINFTITFVIGDMGQGIRFGGHYFAGDNNIPINLIKIGKLKCRQFCESIELFRSHNLVSAKWNTIDLTLDQDNLISYSFRWEEEENRENLT